MNQLGVTQTFNGVGTRVISEGDASIPRKLKDLTLDSNLRSFLDAIQLLTILAEPVMCHTFPHIPADTLDRLAEAVGQKGQKKAMVAAIGMVLQTVVRFSPLASLREIYSKLTHLLLVGSILRLDETGEETVPAGLKSLRPSAKAAVLPGVTYLRMPAAHYLKTALPPPNSPFWKSVSREWRISSDLIEGEMMNKTLENFKEYLKRIKKYEQASA